MAFIRWNDFYGINVAEIDQQHQRLFDLINELYEAHHGPDNCHDPGPGSPDHRAAANPRGQPETVGSVVDELETMLAVLDELIDYTTYHFSAEEEHMVAYGYPVHGPHKAAHNHFVEKIQAFRRDFDEGRAVQPMEILHFLAGWLKQHILGTDKALGKFLNKKGMT